MQHDEFTPYGVGVDGAAILPPVLPCDLPDHERPLRCVCPHDAEASVVDNLTVLESQWHGVLVHPRDLKAHEDDSRSVSQ